MWGLNPPASSSDLAMVCRPRGYVDRLGRRPVLAGWAPETVNITVWGSPVLEERDESIRGSVANWRSLIDCRDAFQGPAFEFEVGMEVDLRGLDVRVPVPERDVRGVDPSVQQTHRAGVPQRVRCDVLPASEEHRPHAVAA